MTVTYTRIGGQLIGETRDGVYTRYLSDPDGNLVGEMNEEGEVTYSCDYWPFGEVRNEIGTKVSDWGFRGLLGCKTDSPNMILCEDQVYQPMYANWLQQAPRQSKPPVWWPGEEDTAPRPVRVPPDGAVSAEEIALEVGGHLVRGKAFGVIMMLLTPCNVPASTSFVDYRFSRLDDPGVLDRSDCDELSRRYHEACSPANTRPCRKGGNQASHIKCAELRLRFARVCDHPLGGSHGNRTREVRRCGHIGEACMAYWHAQECRKQTPSVGIEGPVYDMGAAERYCRRLFKQCQGINNAGFPKDWR